LTATAGSSVGLESGAAAIRGGPRALATRKAAPAQEAAPSLPRPGPVRLLPNEVSRRHSNRRADGGEASDHFHAAELWRRTTKPPARRARRECRRAGQTQGGERSPPRRSRVPIGLGRVEQLALQRALVSSRSRRGSFTIPPWNKPSNAATRSRKSILARRESRRDRARRKSEDPSDLAHAHFLDSKRTKTVRRGAAI